MKKLLAFLLPLALMSYQPHSADKGETPNIVLIFIDDLGYGDVTCNGALDYRTPMIDQLAKEGMRFTNFLTAQAVCSASRAGLLTGCYPNRIGFSGALFPNAKVGISDKETTIADMLKKQGYATCIIGKWHLGDQKPFLPLQHGFDEYLGIPYSNDMWPMDYDGKPATDWRKSSYPTLPLIEGNEVKRHIESLDDQGMLTSWYTERAVDFIRRNKNNPFFLYLPHSMAHVPINASPKFRGKSGAGLFGDVMMELDWSIGEVMKTLKENVLDDNTLVI
ncbi:MAG TPA: sulfatase-like hydrolase/transferase, partial [Flavilitoribacter sp.]|nr:sulfatase-like hydrolase/transferase [Flavilitoribacter sp.]